MTRPEVRCGTATIAYDDVGSGTAVVLLHPGVADRRCWAPTVLALAPHYRVISYDRRGFGETAYAAEPHDPRADLAALLDALEIERAVLVGNSRGGRVATEFTLALPQRVAALVLVGTAMRGAPDPVLTPDVQELSDRLDDLERSGDVDASNALEARIWLDGPSRPEGSVGGAARELFLQMNRRVLTAADAGPEFEPDDGGAWPRLGEIDVPVLCAVGSHDLPYVIERSRRIAELVPGAQYAELPGSAHLPQLDDPEAFNEVLRGFLDRLLASP